MKRNQTEFLACHLKKGGNEDGHLFGFVNIDMTESLAHYLIEVYAKDAPPPPICHEKPTTTPIDGAVYVFEDGKGLNDCQNFPQTDHCTWKNHTKTLKKDITTSRSVIKRNYVWKDTNGLSESTRKKYAYYFPQEKLYVIHYLGSGYKQVMI